jgi:hypothetical protein
MGDTIYVTATAYKKIPYTGYILVQGNAPNIATAPTLLSTTALRAALETLILLPMQAKQLHKRSFAKHGHRYSEQCERHVQPLSSAATITDNTSSFGNIAVGATATALDPFVVRFGNVTDSTAVTFNIVITDAAAHSWNAQFTLYIRAPKLSHYSIIATDVSDGDGYYEPGEDVSVSIELANAGGDHSRSLNGHTD